MNAGLGRATVAGSIPIFWPGGGYDPPRLPPKPTSGNLAHRELREFCCVLPRVPNVDNRQPPARTQHPHGFADGFLPPRASPNCWYGHTRDNYIETVVS